MTPGDGSLKTPTATTTERGVFGADQKHTNYKSDIKTSLFISWDKQGGFRLLDIKVETLTGFIFMCFLAALTALGVCVYASRTATTASASKLAPSQTAPL